jgi:hypothetical protein
MHQGFNWRLIYTEAHGLQKALQKVFSRARWFEWLDSVQKTSRFSSRAQLCFEPVKNCSGVILERNTNELTDGRRHQTLDGQAPSSLGHGKHSRQNNGSSGQSIF